MIYSKTINTVLFGFGASMVKIVIISDQIVKISNFLNNSMHRGYSIGYVVGGKNKIKREKIISFCSLREDILIKYFITKIYEGSFMNIVPIIGAWGKEDGLQKLKEK